MPAHRTPLLGEPVATLPGHAGTVVALAFSPDGRLLATGGAPASLWIVS